MNDAKIEELAKVAESSRRRLVAMAYRMTGDVAAAEDIAQESIIKLLTQTCTYQDDTHVHAWLARVTMNRARDVLRHRQSLAYTGPWLPEPLDTSGFDDTQGESGRGPLDRALTKEAVHYGLMMLFEHLSATQRAVLLLRRLCGYSTRESADMLAISDSNVKTSLKRAKEKLGPLLEQWWRAPNAAMVSAHEARLGELIAAAMAQDIDALHDLMREEIVLTNDAGGDFIAALRPIRGRDRTLRFLATRLLEASAAPRRVDVTECNGLPVVLCELEPSTPRHAAKVVLLCQLRGESFGWLQLLSNLGKTRALFSHDVEGASFSRTESSA